MPTETVIHKDALAALIAKDGVSQKALAQSAGVSPQMVNDVLLGKRMPSAIIRKKLANALRVPVSAIETLIEVPE